MLSLSLKIGLISLKIVKWLHSVVIIMSCVCVRESAALNAFLLCNIKNASLKYKIDTLLRRFLQEIKKKTFMNSEM